MRTADNLVQAMMLDIWPRMAAQVDFGIDSQEKYEAYYDPIRVGEITADQLQLVVGNGESLTKLLRAAPSQRHKDVVIHTIYDGLEDDLP